MSFCTFNAATDYSRIPAGAIAPDGDTPAHLVEAYLKKSGMFFCEKYQCRLDEKHCIAYQQSVARNIGGASASFIAIERNACNDCQQGQAIAEKHNVRIVKADQKRKCKRCGITQPISEFRLETKLCHRRSWICSSCRIKYNEEYNSIIKPELEDIKGA